jgi:hypothetical protein
MKRVTNFKLESDIKYIRNKFIKEFVLYCLLRSKFKRYLFILLNYYLERVRVLLLNEPTVPTLLVSFTATYNYLSNYVQSCLLLQIRPSVLLSLSTLNSYVFRFKRCSKFLLLTKVQIQICQERRSSRLSYSRLIV